jgi:hypothetical protein
MLLNDCCAYRLKGAPTDVQGDSRAFDALQCELRQECGGKV